jgi:drug/metabolite transporter (DMT)-like permease
MGRAQLAGAGLALGGLIVLTAPGIEAPPALAALLMAGAGAAWGAYTLFGRRTDAGPAAAVTARNFVVAGALGAPLLVYLWVTPWTWTGIALAAVSGALASGLGYAVWYTVAPRLGLVTVAVVQLATPVATAIGAAGLLAEPLTWRVAIAGAAILAGVALAGRR